MPPMPSSSTRTSIPALQRSMSLLNTMSFIRPGSQMYAMKFMLCCALSKSSNIAFSQASPLLSRRTWPPLRSGTFSRVATGRRKSDESTAPISSAHMRCGRRPSDQNSEMMAVNVASTPIVKNSSIHQGCASKKSPMHYRIELESGEERMVIGAEHATRTIVAHLIETDDFRVFDALVGAAIHDVIQQQTQPCVEGVPPRAGATRR